MANLALAEKWENFNGGRFDLDFNEFVDGEVNELVQDVKNVIVLVGGTPHQPNSRLLSYFVPAVNMLKKAGNMKDGQVVLSSTARGGAVLNYPDQELLVRGMTDVKLEIGARGIERFFGVNVKLFESEYRPDGEIAKRLWDEAQIVSPDLCASYEGAARWFINKDQNLQSAGEYGVGHAIWAGDVVVDGMEAPHAVVDVGASYGGAKERSFNEVREAVVRLGEDHLSDIFGESVQIRDNLFRVVDPDYVQAVPYGGKVMNLSKKHRGFPVDRGLVGEVRMGSHLADFDEQGPFDIYKPGKKTSIEVVEELDGLVRSIADYQGLTIDQARSAYVDFWNECKNNFGPRVRQLLNFV